MFGPKETVTFAVSDMHCAHCVAKVQSVIKAVKGVVSANVSLENGNATVTYKSNKTDIDTIKAAVTAAGFGV